MSQSAKTMEKTKKTGTPSRSKRSAVNLSDLRLAPLSTKFPEPPRDNSGAGRTPHDETSDHSFVRSHSSYLQGKSAPTTPGILSRSSSRRHLGGGLSRRGSLYDNEAPADITYEYAGVVRDDAGGVRVEVGSGQIPKAKSDAALLVQRNKLATQGRSLQKGQKHLLAPRAKPRPKTVEDDWLTRTGAATNALLQESKGQSWISSRESSASLVHLQDTTDEDDEGYEELAALSAGASRRHLAEDEFSPASARGTNWGSRYGSRTASRRTSRRGSMTLTTGSRTPIATAGGQEAAGYFDGGEAPSVLPMEPDFVDADDERELRDEVELDRLTDNHSFGLGGLVDRLMNFSLFKVEEREEATDDEGEHVDETEEAAKNRMAAESRRRREEKEKLVEAQAGREGGEGGEQGEGGWKDAAWLLGVASKAIF